MKRPRSRPNVSAATGKKAVSASAQGAYDFKCFTSSALSTVTWWRSQGWEELRLWTTVGSFAASCPLDHWGSEERQGVRGLVSPLLCQLGDRHFQRYREDRRRNCCDASSRRPSSTKRGGRQVRPAAQLLQGAQCPTGPHERNVQRACQQQQYRKTETSVTT